MKYKKMKIVVIDNYDSFTWNLVHAVRKLTGAEVKVFRNDEVDMEELESCDKILLSPGPGIPSEAGMMPAIIRELAPRKSILGVCLGHQAIGEAFGARLLNMETVLHGIATPVNIVSRDIPLYLGIPATFDAGRYHSWIVDREDFPECLEITAVDGENRIMSLRHRFYDVQGVQYHPESVLTPVGEKIIKNWLEMEITNKK